MKGLKTSLLGLALLGGLLLPTQVAEAAEGTWQGRNYIKEDGNQAVNEWIYDNAYKSWFYIKEDGTYAENVWLTISGKDYYFRSGGYLATNSWIGRHYVTASGAKAGNGWIYDNHYKSWFYIKSNGEYAENEWSGDYYLKSGGYMAKSEWVKDGNSWFYLKEDGRYVANGWQTIGGQEYYFRPGGYLATNSWIGSYYVTASGAKAKSTWIYDNTYKSWFYLKEDGSYADNGWLTISGKDYYFNSGGYLATSRWIGNYYVSANGDTLKSSWFYDNTYKSWFYLKANGAYANKEWIYDNGYYYLKSGGYMAEKEWVQDKGSWFYLKSGGKMAENELLYDAGYQAWYYFKKGGYMARNESAGGYTLDASGKWRGAEKSSYYKVNPTTANIYGQNGEQLSYVSKGTILVLDKARSRANGRIPVLVSGLAGYVNESDVTATDESKDFIPHFTTDGSYAYHEVASQASVRVGSRPSSMATGQKYYSADGIHFDGFTVDNPFLFRDLRQPSNYTAAELDKVYDLMNVKDSRLAGKGAAFKEAEKRYNINALYLIAHSALESNWGRSQIAKDKNNFFGIAAYDTSPYESAQSFDDVDKGILGAAKWIRENYINKGRTYLGNKASGMNVRYASDPYWGEKIAGIMMRLNSNLGNKD